MTNINKAKQALDAFFEDDIQVLVLKGSWGIGKTHFWQKYINGKKKQKELKQTAYSYVSLFGLNNLLELKEKVFQNGDPIKSEFEVENEFKKAAKENNKLYKHVPWIKDLKEEINSKVSLLGRFTRFGKELPYLKQIASLISTAEYGLVKNYIICFDDIERKGSTLSIKELMGLVDELSIQKKCKIILIFNYQSLDENKDDKSEYEKYREKVVDLEIEFKPSIKENLLHVFPKEDEFFETLLNVFQVLDISNIRIFKKTKWAINKIKNKIDACVKDLQKDIITHLAIFCWGYYNSEDSLPLGFIDSNLKGHSWLSLISDKEKEQSEEEKRWNQIASSLALITALYDDCLISLLGNGYLDKNEFVSTVNKVNEEVEINNARERLLQAWEIYSSSFEDNKDLFVNEIEAVLKKDIDKIGIWDFSSGIDVLVEFGNDVSELVKKYIGANKEILSKINPEDHTFGKKIHNAVLLKAIKDEKKKHENINIDNVVTKIAEQRGWNPEDINFLTSATEEDIYHWMKSNPDNIVTKIQSGLQLFDNLGNSNPEDAKKFKIISENTKKALKKIASENDFNRKRIKLIYKIEVDDQEKT